MYAGLPLEIWSRVFSYACSDDGRTGRSLSRVSLYFYNASKIAKLQSLAIVGQCQIKGCAVMLGNTPPRFCRVYNLFISTYTPSESELEAEVTEGQEFL